MSKAVGNRICLKYSAKIYVLHTISLSIQHLALNQRSDFYLLRWELNQLGMLIVILVRVNGRPAKRAWTNIGQDLLIEIMKRHVALIAAMSAHKKFREDLPAVVSFCLFESVAYQRAILEAQHAHEAIIHCWVNQNMAMLQLGMIVKRHHDRIRRAETERKAVISNVQPSECWAVVTGKGNHFASGIEAVALYEEISNRAENGITRNGLA